MKQMKTWLSLLLALLLCLSAAACAADPTPSTGGNAPAVPSFPISGGTIPAETTEPKPEIICQRLPAEVEAPDGVPVLKWVCISYYNDTIYNEEAAKEINKVLAEKGLPFRLQFIIWSATAYLDLMLEPEVTASLAEADLICGDFKRKDAETYLMPITEYIRGDSSPSLKDAVPHNAYWYSGLRGDEIYGIPTNVLYTMSNGWWVSESVLTTMGITEADFDGDFWKMDDLFARIYEANDRRPFLYCDRAPGVSGYSVGRMLQDYTPSIFSFTLPNHFQQIGSCFAIDYRNGTPKVVNYLETEYVRKSQDAMKRYADAGYTTTESSDMLVSYSNIFSNETVYSAEDKTYYIPNESLRFPTNANGGTLAGVAAATRYSAEALLLLALIADDGHFRELVLFGAEGQDHTRTDSGGFSTITRDDGTLYRMSQLSPFAGLYSNAFEIHLPVKEGSTRLETHKALIGDSHLEIPIIFDFSAVADETAAVNAFLARVGEKEDDPPIFFGRVGYLTDAEYDQMLAEIRAAGGDKIQAELQRQLDAWLAENPDWNK